MAAQRNYAVRASASHPPSSSSPFSASVPPAPARPGLSVPMRLPTSPPARPLSLAGAQDCPAPEAAAAAGAAAAPSTPVNARRTVPINAAPHPVTLCSSPQQASPYVPPRAAVCRFGWSAVSDLGRVPHPRLLCLANDEQNPIFCQTPRELAAFSLGLKPIFGEGAQGDFCFYGGLRARLVDVVISDATSAEQGLQDTDTVCITQCGMQLIGSANTAAWPLHNSDPRENFGGNWWVPTYYLPPEVPGAARATPVVYDASSNNLAHSFGPVLISAGDLTSVLTKMGTFKLAGEVAREIEREREVRMRPQLVDSMAVAKMAHALEIATVKLEMEPQAPVHSAPRPADVTRLAAAAANYAQVLHARELRAWQERAEGN